MEYYIPLFPLKLVVFPNEDLNLHIFEPRYKQLIMDIQKNGGHFGIGVYLDSMLEIGTEVELVEVSKIYEDGRMDIMTKAKRLFEIVRLDNPMKGKLYAGASILYKDIVETEKLPLHLYEDFETKLKELFLLMNYELDFDLENINSFTLAHKIGLTIAEEYELLTIPNESSRLKYLIRHLSKVIPILREIETAKKKIQMNGHFKNMDPLDF